MCVHKTTKAVKKHTLQVRQIIILGNNVYEIRSKKVGNLKSIGIKTMF